MTPEEILRKRREQSQGATVAVAGGAARDTVTVSNPISGAVRGARSPAVCSFKLTTCRWLATVRSNQLSTCCGCLRRAVAHGRPRLAALQARESR